MHLNIHVIETSESNVVGDISKTITSKDIAVQYLPTNQNDKEITACELECIQHIVFGMLGVVWSKV